MKYFVGIILFLITRHICSAQINDTLHFKAVGGKEFVTVLPDDSIYFCIALNNKNFKVKLKGNWVSFDDIKKVERFMDLNQKLIDPDKILIIASGKMTYKEFQPIIMLFKKRDWMHFNLVDTDKQ